MPTQIVGIVNLTTDSFSDGGQFLATEQAVAQAERLIGEGADWLDLGAESSNPDGEKVSAELEIARLDPVIAALKSKGIPLAVDTHKSVVMAHCLARGVSMINDITALRGDPASIEVLRNYPVPVVLMFARNQSARAQRAPGDAEVVMEQLRRFFGERIEFLLGCGLLEEQLILDPGMGFFLGSNPEPSLRVLRELESLRSFGRPLYLSVSRKSFIGSILGGRPPNDRAHATLAAEIWAYLQGVDFIRTHAVAPLGDAVRLLEAIRFR